VQTLIQQLFMHLFLEECYIAVYDLK